MGYLLWGRVKTVAFWSQPHSLDESQFRITNEFNEIQCVCIELVSDFKWYVLIDGDHIEVWQFNMYCLEAVNLRFYMTFTVCFCRVYVKSYYRWNYGQILYIHPVLPVYSANSFKHMDGFKPSIFTETCNISEGRLSYAQLMSLHTD
jgi:hypothetical protein